MFISHHGKLRIIDAGKCVIAHGFHFFCTGAGNDFPSEHKAHPAGRIIKSIGDTVPQVHSGIGNLHFQRPLGAGEHNGLRRVLYHIGKRRRRIGHGICAVADYEAVKGFIIFLYGMCDLHPVPTGHICAVYAKQVLRLQAAHIIHKRQKFQNFLRSQRRRQPMLCFVGGNGASGGKQQYFFLCHLHSPPPGGADTALQNVLSYLCQGLFSSSPIENSSFTWSSMLSSGL